MRKPAIELANVTKSWGLVKAVDQLSFTVEAGTFLVLLGPSGCGKSTTLRMIAGLDEATSGRIHIDGEDMTDAPPSHRQVSMVFQSYALFPHLDVRQNILFGLKVRKVPVPEQNKRLERVASMVGLSGLLNRKPSQLSGGQRQRVAVARAVVAENPICLMDEPLSNLDAKLRHEMRVELRELQQRLGMTVVYVTHDQTEAMSMADKVVLIREGRSEQIGAPVDLYNKPATTFTAGFIGTPPMNLLALAAGPSGAKIAGTNGPAVAGEAGTGTILGIRPEHIAIGGKGGIPARIKSSDYLGADTIVTALIGEQEMLVRVPGHLTVPAGQTVKLKWGKVNAHLFDAASGKRLDAVRALSIAA